MKIQKEVQMFKMTLNTVETRKSEAGKGDYTYAKVTLHKKDGTDKEGVVAMAFGAQRDSVKRFLVAGKTVEVSAIWDRGTLKILGPRTGAVKGSDVKAAA